MQQVYPVVFSPAREGGYCVHVPGWDIDTQGDTMAEAIYMARDAIGAMGCYFQDEKRTLPDPQPIDSVKAASGDIVSLVDVNFDAYRRRHDMRTIRKNLTIPSWLNDAAEEKGINFSQVLQESLRDRLGL